MKTKILMSLVLVTTTILIAACTEDGQITEFCGQNLIICAVDCLENPNQPGCSSSSLEENPELKKAIDSLRAVSNLPVRE